MELILVRHGEAKASIEDPRRSLTERGAEAVRGMAAWAGQAGVQVDQIRHSGIARAEQTAALLAERLNPAGGTIAVEGLEPDDEVRPVADTLRDGQESVMLVGHMPFLGSLAGLLLAGNSDAGAIGFPPAGMACLAREEGKWSVKWVMSPELL